MRFIKKVLAQAITFLLTWSVKEKAMLFAAVSGVMLIEAVRAFKAGTQGEFVYFAILFVVFSELMYRQMNKLKVVEVSSGS